MKVHTFNVLKVSVFAAISAVATSLPVSAASITNGDFENSSFIAPTIENFVGPDGQNGFARLAAGNTSINGFTATGFGATYIGNGIFNNNGALSRTVQLNGTNIGGISTTVSGLNTGNTVQVSFDLSSNIGASAPSVVVNLQGAGAQTFSLPSQTVFVPGNGAIANLPFTRFVASFLYTGTSPTALLSFSSLTSSPTGNGTLGPIIDNVAVSAVPFEFSPATGIVSGAILFGSYKLIKRKKSTVKL